MICPFCNKHKLIIYYMSETVPNGSGSAHFQGYYAGCKVPSDFNCPDTTGIFDTEEDASNAAEEIINEMY